MTKRSFSLLVALALVASVFTVLPAVSAAAQEAKPFGCGELFTDPADDADFENLDVLNGGIAANDDSTFTVEMRVKNLSTDVPPDAQGLTWYFIWTHADVNYFANAAYSMWTDAITYNLGTLDGTQFSTTASTEGTFTEGENGAITVVVPYEEVGAPASGAVLADTYADTRVRLGGPAGPGVVSAADRAPDGTGFGTSYTLGSCGSGGPVVAEPKPEPPGKADPPGKGKKKGCKKGKGKKKGACPGKKPPKPPEPPACPAYTPGEEGAETETTVVTDAATAEAPIVVELEAPPGGGNDLGLPGIVGQDSVYDNTASIFHNIQVDSAAADAGLYVRYEFPDRHDYDLYLLRPDGSTAANSGDFNIAPGVSVPGLGGVGGGSPEGAWEAGSNYEQVMGIRTADCAGYTARLVSYLTTGGATSLKIWLGEAIADPVPPPEGESALDMLYRAFGL